MDNASAYGPGIGAFAIFFILAIVLWLLMRNMNARLRRMSYARRDEEKQAATGDHAAPAAADRSNPSKRQGQADTDDNASDAAT